MLNLSKNIFLPEFQKEKHGNDQTNYKSTGYFGDQNIDNKYKELLRNSTVWEDRHFDFN